MYQLRILVSIATIFSVTDFSSSLNINCIYRLKFYNKFKIIYHCEAENLIVIDQNTSVINVTGIHFNQPIYDDYGIFKGLTIYQDKDVKGLEMEFSVIYYFPQNLDKKFPNLIAISILNSKLREIHQKDLQPFTKLEYLSLKSNEIQVIEKHLFKFNENLKIVSLVHNHIKHVDPRVFDSLQDLTTLQFALNPCLSHTLSIDNDPKEVIRQLLLKCKPRDDDSSDWKKQEETDIENCEYFVESCREFTVTASLFSVISVIVIGFIIFDRFFSKRIIKYEREEIVMN